MQKSDDIKKSGQQATVKKPKSHGYGSPDVIENSKTEKIFTSSTMEGFNFQRKRLNTQSNTSSKFAYFNKIEMQIDVALPYKLSMYLEK
jgi:hypothetical protein